MRSRSFAQAVVAVIIGSTVVARVTPDHGSSNVIATSGAPSLQRPECKGADQLAVLTTDVGNGVAW
jgi:hypothetical protein